MPPKLTKARKQNRLIEQTRFWAPPIPDWKPLKTGLQDVTLACIVEERLYHGLRFEARSLLVTPNNWKTLLAYNKPDFLLIESVGTSFCGSWHLGPGGDDWATQAIEEMVSLAKQLFIPTVFWMTKGHEYHEFYKDLIRHFDYIFCSDPLEIAQIRSEGKDALYLPPCIQPALYNPFRYYEYGNPLDLNVLYDGIADLDRFGEKLGILNDMGRFGVSVIESRCHIPRRQFRDFSGSLGNILGCTTKASRLLALKYANIYPTFEHTLSTKTEQQWMTLEAGACRLALVHHGELEDNDIRKGIVAEAPDDIEFLVELTRFEKENFYCKRIAHKQWRAIHQHHTFAHRMASIQSALGINSGRINSPDISVVAMGSESEKMNTCCQHFQRQVYENKEMIHIGPNTAIENALKDHGFSRFHSSCLPEEVAYGARLNYAFSKAGGDYCFCFNHRNFYGENYILDIVLNLKAVDVDILTKSIATIDWQNSTIGEKGNKPPCFSIIPNKELLSGRMRVDPDTSCLANRFFKANRFDASYQGNRDLVLASNTEIPKDGYFVTLDGLNLFDDTAQKMCSHSVNPPEFHSRDNDCIISSLVI